MKLHLPVLLRSALLAACALAGLTNYTEAASRYWQDSYGQQHFLNDKEWQLGIDNAEAFIIKDCVNETQDSACSGGGLYYGVNHVHSSDYGMSREDWMLWLWEDDRINTLGKEIVTAKQVTFTGNRLINSGFQQNPYSEGGALTIDFMDMEGETYDSSIYDHVPQFRYFIFSGCKEITITNNGAESYYDTSEFGSSYTGEELTGWSGMSAWGGAIECFGNHGIIQNDDYGDYSSTRLTERRSVLEFRDNDHVFIRGNYAMSNGKVFLNSIETMDADLIFAAAEGQTIECYDGMLVDGKLWINMIRYNNYSNVPSNYYSDPSYSGTIILSGKYAEEDLTSIKNGVAPTEEELEYSRRIYTEAVQIGSGKLVLEDIELYAVQDLSISAIYHGTLFEADYDSEVQLKNATIHTEYGEFNAWWQSPYYNTSPVQYGTISIHSATFTGHNTFVANYVEAYSGVWTFNVGEENRENALLTIVSNDVHTYNENPVVFASDNLFNAYNMTFCINAEEGLSAGKYKLIEMDIALAKSWDSSSITVEGVDSDFIGSKEVYFTIDDDTLTLWYNTLTYGTARPETTLTWAIDKGTWSENGNDDTWRGDVEDTSFHRGDSVIFNEAAEVKVSGEVLPGHITVSNETGCVQLSSSEDEVPDEENPEETKIIRGTIAGATGLTKTGEGELAIDMANTYTGDTIIDGGIVNIYNRQALGFSDIYLKNGTLNMNSRSLTADIYVTGKATILGAYYYNGNLTLDGGTLDGDLIYVGDDKTLELISGRIENDLEGGNYSISTSQIIKTGEGTATLSGKISCFEENGIDVQSGTLELLGSTLDEVTLTVQEGATLTMQHVSLEDSHIYLSEGAAANVGSLTLGINTSLHSNGADIEGNITLNGGELVTEQAQSIAGSLTLSGGNVQLADTIELQGKVRTTEKTALTLDVQQLRAQRHMDLFTAADTTEVSTEHLAFNQLRQARYEVGKTDTSVWVELKNAKLTWKPDDTNNWGLMDDGGTWDTEGSDQRFYEYDDVVFEDAGDVNIVGEVRPGEITVQGKGDTAFVGEGSIVGDATLIKQGSGTLRIDTENYNYEGDIIVKGGTLEIGIDQALTYAQNALLRIEDGATFDGGDHFMSREVTMCGHSTIKRADNMSVRFASGAVVSGSYSLNCSLTIEKGGAEFAGNFHFGRGSWLTLQGGTFTISGKVTHDEFYNLDDYYSDYYPYAGRYMYEGLPALTTIDVSSWEDLGIGDYELLTLNLEKGINIDNLFDVYFGFENGYEGYLEYVGDTVILHVTERTSVEISEAINDLPSTENQAQVLSAILSLANNGELNGELKSISIPILSGADPDEARAILDALSGAELATAMTSQIEGNMAHLRRLRSNMGSGMRLDDEGKNTAYVVGYDGQNHVDANATGPGIKRTETGGTLGFERCIREQSLFGFALTSGSATVNPTQGKSYDEDVLRIDIYGVGNFGGGWQSVMSVGFGMHEFSISRQLPNGSTATSSPQGYSLNVQNEVSYTKQINDNNSVQPFVAFEASLNVIPAYSESGTGNASLEAHDYATSAVDITLGARYIRSFETAGRKGNVSVQAAIVMSAGENAAQQEMNFVGAEDQRFTVGAASTDAMGFNLGANLLLPISKHAAVTASASATLRSGSQESGASVGVRLTF